MQRNLPLPSAFSGAATRWYHIIASQQYDSLPEFSLHPADRHQSYRYLFFGWRRCWFQHILSTTDRRSTILRHRNLLAGMQRYANAVYEGIVRGGTHYFNLGRRAHGSVSITK